MLHKNTKNITLVLFGLVAAAVLGGCGRHGLVSGGERPQFDGERSTYSSPKKTGKIESSDIDESSGIAVSKCQPGVLWTHNDSGDGPFIFAMDETGKDLGTWKITDAENVDWEDIASFKDTRGNCFIYVGDTGNGNKNPRTEQRIYRVAEPIVPAGGSRTTRKDPAAAGPAEALLFSYPDGPHDAETLMVHPVTGDIYVVTKIKNTVASVYRLKPVFGGEIVKAEKVSDISVPAIPNGLLTGGDIAPDGKRLVLCDYFAGYEFLLPADSTNFDDIWKQKPIVIELGDREQGESIGYSADGNSLFATSEGKHEPLIRVDKR